MDFFLFLISMERITGEPCNPKLKEYAKKRAIKEIHRSVGYLLNKTPIPVTEIKFRRWGK